MSRLGLVQKTEDKTQTAVNTRVSSKCIEEGDALISLHERNLIHVRSTITQLDNRLESSLKAMQNCGAEYHWALPCNWAFDTMIDRFGFVLTPQELAELDKHADFDPSPAIFSITELGEAEVSRARMRHHRDGLAPLNVQARQPIADHVISIYDFLYADVLSHAKDELSRTDVGIARLIKTINSEKAARDEALLESNPQRAEKHHRNVVDAYVELLEILNSRISQLLLTNNDTNNFRGQANAALDEAGKAFQGFLENSKQLLDKVIKDLETSDAVGEDEHQKDGAAQKDFALYEKETVDDLLKNAERQKDIFCQIQALADEMKVLAEDRLSRLEEFNSRKSVEEKRIANYDEFKTVHADHLRYLNRLRELAENRVSAAEQLMSYHELMSRKIAEKDVEGELEGLTQDEARNYLEHYRGFIFSIGDLMTRKDLRIETLLRQQRHVQLQKDVALDSLDPEADQYNSRYEALSNLVDDCESDLAQLRVTQDICTENFKEVEAVLLKHAIPFEHPLVEYAEEAAQNRERYVAKAQHFVENEETEVEHSKKRMKNLQSVAEHERKALRAKAEESAAVAVQKAKSPKPPARKRESEGPTETTTDENPEAENASPNEDH